MNKPPEHPVFRDPSRPVSERVEHLLGLLSLEEKKAWMTHNWPGIERLGIPAYSWLNECLHGVARAGTATVFPQAIGMAASWNPGLMRRVATAIADEARAKHHESARMGDRGLYKGLTFYSPNINIFRDARWGRGHETYGEDPWLTAQMAMAFISGLQGDDPDYLKVAACAKHFAVHSGPESQRMTFDVWPSHRDLRETYLPAFRAAVREAKVASVMAAYNRLYGDPCCASRLLLEEILRKEWGFEGFVVSDGGGFDFVHGNHMVSCGPAETVAMSFRNGCDMELGNVCEKGLGAALERGLLTAADLDRCLRHSLTILFRLGFFDADGGPYAATPYRVVGCREHRELALEMARQSLVLIKNENRLLPLSRDLANVAVIGPNADSRAVLIGNYNGIPARQITALQGIQDLAGEATRIWFAQGCDLTDKPVFFAFGPKERNLSEAVAAAKRSAVAILCLGLDPTMEGENGDPEADETDAGGDRRTLDLPKSQQELLRAIRATGTPVVLVLFGGSPVTGVYQHADAVIQAFYPGEAGGQALAEVLFGDVNPAGRLPVTIPQSTEQLPPFADYQMRGRTYRFMAETPAYCFGHGLSYTTFEYTDVALSRAHIQAGQTVELSVRVRNTGPRAGDEVVQVYLRDVEASVPVPRVKLCGATRISLAPGEQKSVSVHIPEQAFQAYDDKGAPRIETGVFELFVGGGCPRQEGVRGQWTSLTVT